MGKANDIMNQVAKHVADMHSKMMKPSKKEEDSESPEFKKAEAGMEDAEAQDMQPKKKPSRFRKFQKK